MSVANTAATSSRKSITPMRYLYDDDKISTKQALVGMKDDSTVSGDDDWIDLTAL